MEDNWSKNDNPLSLDGIEFVEFASPDPRKLEKMFSHLGFSLWGKHRKKSVTWFRQNQLNFILNEDPDSFAASFAQKHGPSIVATAFRVKISAEEAMKKANSRGAKGLEGGINSGHSFPGIYGIGNSAVYFVDRYHSSSTQNSFYHDDFEVLSESNKKRDSGPNLLSIDHLTNNVPRGEMQKWCDFYSQVFAFREVRLFNIKGAKTGLVSKVMRSPCGNITIPINEPTDGKSQIQEYLDEYHGSGIQHLAFLTQDIVSSVDHLQKKGVQFLDVPDAYYEMLFDRVPGVTENLEVLKKHRVLVDGDPEGYLLQMFTQNMIGPIFFEIIQRKNHFGFGEGNFQALFDAIERDQQRRGYLS